MSTDTGTPQGFTTSADFRCTNGCTDEGGNENETTRQGGVDQAVATGQQIAGDTTLATLAAALIGLSEADRAKLVAMLLRGPIGESSEASRRNEVS
ncbi:MAG TPA: hypothetical protein VHC22_23815 [Pirellulales bacterium]|nr:hypothetical protein [Pirellulales bacterium]